VALEGMDPDNSKELEKDRKNLQQVERQRAKRYMRAKWCKSMGTGSGSRKHRSNMKWARAYLPQDLPPRITLCTFIGLRIGALGSLAMTMITTLL
jgi:hypothetical protein